MNTAGPDRQVKSGRAQGQDATGGGGAGVTALVSAGGNAIPEAGPAMIGNGSGVTTSALSKLSNEILNSSNAVLLPNKKFWAEIMTAIESFPLKSVACRIKASQAIAFLQENYSGA